MKLTTTKVFHKNAEALAEGYRYVINEGSTRSSKTYSAIELAILLSIFKPALRVIIVGVTLSIVKRNIVKEMKNILSDSWRKVGVMKISDMVFEFHNGSEIVLVSAENYEKYHGVDSDYIFLEEPNIFKEGDKLIEQFAIRCRGSLVLTLNPSRKLDWLIKIQQRPDCKYIHSTYKDNQFLEQRVIDEIEARAKVDPRFKRVYVEGLYVANLEEAVFTNWGISDNYPKIEDVKIHGYGLDWGFANDPTVLIEGCIYNSEYHLKEHFRAAKMVTKDILTELLKLPKGSIVVCDNSEPRLIVELRTSLKGHVTLIKAKKPKGSIRAGIKLMQSIWINLHSRSPKLISEFESYKWKKVSGELTDTPEDKNNHAPDAARYLFDYLTAGKFNAI